MTANRLTPGFLVPCVLFCCGLLTLAASDSVYADELEVDLPLTEVTVHPRSAVITRSAELSISEGSHTLVLGGLPEHLDLSRLQLQIESPDVRFSNLQLSTAHQGDLVNPRENALRQQIRELGDAREVIVDRIATAESELEFLGSLSTGESAGGGDAPALLNLLAEGSAQARGRIREARIELRELDARIEQLEYEVQQVATRHRVFSELRVNLQAAQAVTARVTIRYPRNEASWSWSNEARLDTAGARVELYRRAAVQQGTGEDWEDVRLRLSTAMPSTQLAPPGLPPVFVDLDRRAAEMARSRVSGAAAADALEEVTVSGSFVAAERQGTDYVLAYEIPDPVTVRADGQRSVLPVDELAFEVDLVARAVPAIRPRAYLEARFVYDNDFPVQAGPTEFYRDGSYVGRSQLPLLLSGADVRMPFGEDERIRVQRFAEEQASREASGFSRRSVREEKWRFEVSSGHQQAVTVEVLDRVPVSRNSDIDVEIPRDATPATETDVDGEAGLLLWRFRLAPQQTERIQHYYQITYPRDEDIRLQP